VTHNRTQSTVVWTAIWAVAFAAGLYGLYLRFAGGHVQAGYGTAIPWGRWVALYSMLTSMAAGLYIITSLPVLFGVRRLDPIVKPALWASLASLIGGLVSIGLDLGHAFRAWEVFARPNFGSVMAVLVWLYALFAIVLLLQLAALRSGASARQYAWVGLPLAVAMAGAGGALYAAAGRPFWHTGLLPILVIVGGLLTASALLTLLSALRNTQLTETTALLGRTTLVLLVVDLILEWAEYSVNLFGGSAAATEATRLVLFGPDAWVFWGVHLAVGSAVPLALLALAPRNRSSLLASGLLVVGTYLSVRVNIVIPGLSVPQIDGLEHAYIEPGLGYAYTPTLMEWLVALFAVCLAILIFNLGNRWSQGTAGATKGKEA